MSMKAGKMVLSRLVKEAICSDRRRRGTLSIRRGQGGMVVATNEYLRYGSDCERAGASDVTRASTGPWLVTSKGGFDTLPQSTHIFGSNLNSYLSLTIYKRD